MKRILPILLAILGAVTALSVLVFLTRTGSWPTNMRALDWRRVAQPTVGETIDEAVATAADTLSA